MIKANDLKTYLQIIILCGTLLSGFWFGLVRPAIKEVIKEDIAFTNFLIFEIINENQYQSALKKFHQYKEAGVLKEAKK